MKIEDDQLYVKIFSLIYCFSSTKVFKEGKTLNETVGLVEKMNDRRSG